MQDFLRDGHSPVLKVGIGQPPPPHTTTAPNQISGPHETLFGNIKIYTIGRKTSVPKCATHSDKEKKIIM